MPHYQAWEEFTRAAEKLYLADPMKVRVVLKYRHCDGNLCIKVTDDVACLLYRTDQAQDVKKIEKFHSQLMRLMVAKESRSAAMETDWTAENKGALRSYFTGRKHLLDLNKQWDRRCFYIPKWTVDKSRASSSPGSTLEN